MIFDLFSFLEELYMTKKVITFKSLKTVIFDIKIIKKITKIFLNKF